MFKSVTSVAVFASLCLALAPVCVISDAAYAQPEANKPAGEAEAKPKAKANATAKAKPKDTKKPAAKKDPNMVNATFKTNMGDIKIAFDKEKAPNSVAQFEKLIKAGFYKDIIFHRVINGFMIQAGAHDATLKQFATVDKTDKGEKIAQLKHEGNNGLKNLRGTVALARTNMPDSASSQFFVNLKDNAFLDYQSTASPGYTVIGKVVEGMDVVDKIALVPTESVAGTADVPKKPVIISEAKID